VFNNPVSYVDPTGLSWWDKVKSLGRGLWNGFWGVVHEAVLIPVDIVGTSVDTLLGVVHYGFGTSLSFGYEARSYYGQALEDHLRHGDLDGFWDLAGTTAVDAFLLGLPSIYVAIEEAVTEGNLEPLGEVLGSYGGAVALVYAGRYAGRCVGRVVPPWQPRTAPRAKPPKPPGRPTIEPPTSQPVERVRPPHSTRVRQPTRPSLQAPHWEWRGRGPVGSDRGAWYNLKTDEYLRPDFHHAPPIEPHWDYRDPDGNRWRNSELLSTSV
jgi:hypothetical protein